MGLAWTSLWGLVGLVALPLIWWLQKRLRRPPDVELPSLMFLLDEEDARALPRGRLMDAELLLALTAAALIALAAAGPVLTSEAPRTVVRVAVSAGAPAERMPYLPDVERALDDLRAGLDDHGELDVRWVPERPDMQRRPHARRPDAEALLTEVQAGVASARVIVSDAERPASLPADIRWVTVGTQDGSNTGIVAVRVDDEGLFVTLTHRGPKPASGVVLALGDRGGDRAPFSVGTDGYASVRLGRSHAGSDVVRVALAKDPSTPWTDDLEADDVVELSRHPMAVHVSEGLSPVLVARIDEALTAALGEGGHERDARAPRLAFVAEGVAVPDGAAQVLVLRQLAEGEPAVVLDRGLLRAGGDPVIRDLAGAAGPFTVPGSVVKPAEGEAVLFERLADGRAWPLIIRAGRRVHLVADPLRGAPAPVATPFWPLLIQNLVAATGHREVGAGWRAEGLLHAPSSRTAAQATSVDPAWLANLPAAHPGRSRPLRPPLIVAALLCLALLWALPRLRGLAARRRAARANPHVARGSHPG